MLAKLAGNEFFLGDYDLENKANVAQLRLTQSWAEIDNLSIKSFPVPGYCQ